MLRKIIDFKAIFKGIENMEIKFIVPGNPITKKNSQRICKTKNGRSFIMPSKNYVDYENNFCIFASRYKKKIDYPINIKCVYYMQTRRKVDLTNLLSATMDCLVSSGVIVDDNRNIAGANDGSRVFYDKENPRVEITISDLNNYEKWQ